MDRKYKPHWIMVAHSRHLRPSYLYEKERHGHVSKMSWSWSRDDTSYCPFVKAKDDSGQKKSNVDWRIDAEDRKALTACMWTEVKSREDEHVYDLKVATQQ